MITEGDSAQMVVTEWSDRRWVAAGSPGLCSWKDGLLHLAWSRSAEGRSKRRNRFIQAPKWVKFIHFPHESWNQKSMNNIFFIISISSESTEKSVKIVHHNLCESCKALDKYNKYNFNFNPLEIVPSHRDPKLQVAENYSYMFNSKPNSFQILIAKEPFHSEYRLTRQNKNDHHTGKSSYDVYLMVIITTRYFFLFCCSSFFIAIHISMFILL